jgi:hypothetical protein
MAEMLRAKSAFSFDADGVPVSVREGDLRPKGHRDTKGHEELFETVEQADSRIRAHTTYAAERATAAPGDPRVLTHPSKPGAKS